MSRRGGTRISGGEYKGRRIAVPGGVRPTGGLIKEALFSMWAERIPGSRFLDLFAGSGAVGLDALSRGAVSVTWVEGDPRVARTTRHSVERVAGVGSSVLLAYLPEQSSRLPAGPFDLVFADPPYDFDRYEDLVSVVEGILAPDGALALEHAARVTLPKVIAGMEMEDSRSYGDSKLARYAPASQSGPAGNH